MDKYKLEMSVKFKRDVKRCKKRGLPLDELWDVIRTLAPWRDTSSEV